MTIALALVAAIYVASLALRMALARSYAASLETPSEPLQADTVTLVQPILSGDPMLESRLEANLRELPDQPFLWLIDDDDDEAQRIARDLRARHPAAKLEVLICPPCPDAINPKLWKLRDAATRVTTPCFGVLDDDTVLSAASAAVLTGSSAGHIVATALPCYEAAPGMPSALLAQFVNNNSAFTYLGTSRLLAPFTVNGMAYMLRTDDLPRLGHFTPIFGELTDDLALATLMLKRGGTIRQTTAVVRVQTGVESFVHYLRFMHRWYVFTLLLMKRQRLPVQLLIFLMHGLPPMLLIALLVLAAVHVTATSAAIAGAVLILRGIILVSTLHRFFGRGLHRPLLSVISELMQPVHLVHAMACRTIRWRTRRYRVRDTDDFSAA